MHPLVAQILQQIMQAMQSGALPPEALMQLHEELMKMAQGMGGGGMPMPGMGPGGAPGMPPQGQDPAAMMALLSQGG